MNAVAKIDPADHSELVRVLQSSLYPGASVGAIEMVLSWCRLNSIDPMLRPVHIVPQRVKNENGDWESRDVLMPGISLYRILAARSGEYGGKSEPEYGPDVNTSLGGVKITFPRWCKITVTRVIAGHPRTFTATEYWLENYREAGRDTEAPNTMWRKRAYAQLAKCAEAQALRQAFPEFTGGMPSAEEMEGKQLTPEDFNGTTIDHTEESSEPPKEPRSRVDEWLDGLEKKLASVRSNEALDRVLGRSDVQQAQVKLTNGHKERLDAMIREALDRFRSDDVNPEDRLEA